MLTIGVILIIVSILLIIYSLYSLRHIKQKNEYVLEYNRQLDNQTKELQKEYQKAVENISKIKDEMLIADEDYRDIKKEVSVATKELIDTRNHLNDIQNNISKTIDNQKEMSQKAFENYCQVLEKQYDEYEEEYDMYKDALETAYSNRQLELLREMNEVQEELNQIKATRDATRQAITREKEIEQKLSFYCLQISEADLKDIAVLETVAPKLSKPRILYMLIWQTFFRTPMTNLCNNIIGAKTKSGIYKITNIKTKECYIGQAVDLASRWKDHAKFGLRIDTPAGNQLYKAMIEFGIWNFSWEVLEEVPPAQLNEKEVYYIDLYDSKNFGYNQTKGNK